MKIAVYTPTIEDYIEVVKYALSIGLTWNSGASGIYPEQFEHYYPDTHVYIGNNELFYNNGSYLSTYEKLNMNEFRLEFKAYKILKDFR